MKTGVRSACRWRGVLFSPLLLTLGLALGPPCLRLQAAAPQFDTERLRSLLELPSVNVEMGLEFNSQGRYLINQQRLESFSTNSAPERLAQARNALKTDEGNAERWEALADLYATLEDASNVTLARNKAIELYRQGVRTDPGNAQLKCRLGSLLPTGPEAEALLRSATAQAPGNWRGWVGLVEAGVS